MRDDDYADLSPAPAGSGSVYRDAYARLADRDPASALDLIEPALEASPSDRGLRSLRAWAFLLRAQLQKAETELRSLVDEDPSDAWAHHALGRALERQSRPAEALPHLRLAAAMTGDAVHAAAARRVEMALAASR